MVGRAVEAQVDAERDRCPCRVLLAAVEANLRGASGVSSRLGGSSRRAVEGGREALTLLAGFVLSFSKILSDCCLVARLLMVTVILGDVVCWYRRRRTARGRERMSTVWSWSWSLKHVVVAPIQDKVGRLFRIAILASTRVR